MATLSYVGSAQQNPNDLVNDGYVNSLLSLDLPQATVDSLINSGLSGYVTKAYVDSQDALNATKAFIDAGDATRLHLSQVGVPNGVAGLNNLGRIDTGRVSVASTQRFPKPFYSPSAYNTAAVAASTAETQVYPAMSVADPGFTYKLLIFGAVDAATSVDGAYPIVRVRVGSMTGPIVAGGYGLGEKYTGGVLTPYTTHGSYSYTVPSWAQTVDCIALGAGGGGSLGSAGFFGLGAGPGNQGGGGAFSTVTLTRGTTLPTGGSLNTTVGTAGAAGANGGASSVSATGMTTLTAAGGSSGGGTSSPGTKVFNGNSYVGGATQAITAGSGNPPGGGGGPGATGGGSPGGPGADGAVWFLAAPSPNTPSGPVLLVPTPYNAQAAITGATSLYVTVQRSDTASTQTVSTLRPSLYVVPIPA